MYVLVFWLNCRTTSIVEKKKVKYIKGTDRVRALYDGKYLDAKVVKESDSREWLGTLIVTTEGNIDSSAVTPRTSSGTPNKSDTDGTDMADSDDYSAKHSKQEEQIREKQNIVKGNVSKADGKAKLLKQKSVAAARDVPLLQNPGIFKQQESNKNAEMDTTTEIPKKTIKSKNTRSEKNKTSSETKVIESKIAERKNEVNKKKESTSTSSRSEKIDDPTDKQKKSSTIKTNGVKKGKPKQKPVIKRYDEDKNKNENSTLTANYNSSQLKRKLAEVEDTKESSKTKKKSVQTEQPHSRVFNTGEVSSLQSAVVNVGTKYKLGNSTVQKVGGNRQIISDDEKISASVNMRSNSSFDDCSASNVSSPRKAVGVGNFRTRHDSTVADNSDDDAMSNNDRKSDANDNEMLESDASDDDGVSAGDSNDDNEMPNADASGDDESHHSRVDSGDNADLDISEAEQLDSDEEEGIDNRSTHANEESSGTTRLQSLIEQLPPLTANTVSFFKAFATFIEAMYEEAAKTNSRRPDADIIGEPQVELQSNSGFFLDKKEVANILEYKKKPREMVRRLMRQIIGDKELRGMSATGRGARPGIPEEVRVLVQKFVRKNSAVDAEKLTSMEYKRTLNLMCSTLRAQYKKQKE